jgi:hypothetical protein
MKTERFIVKKIVMFGLMCGYKIYDTHTKKYLPWSFDEHEEYLAESKCSLKNALNSK